MRNILRRSSDQPQVTDDGVLIFSDLEYYDPFRTASARSYWRIQAINSHIVNLFGSAEIENEPEWMEESSAFLIPQWAADLQIDCNAFGVAVRGSSGEILVVQYVSPGSMTVVINEFGQLVCYEVEGKYQGKQTFTSLPIKRGVYSGKENQFLPEEVIHLKNGLDPHYGELMGDNKLRSVLDMIRMDAELNKFTLDIIKNVAANSFLLMPPKDSDSRAEAMKAAAAKIRTMLTRVNRGGAGILPENMEVKDVGKNPRDLQFSDLHKDPESAIASSFNVEPIRMKWRVGSEQSTYSNVEQARINEQQELVFPLAKLLEDGINRWMRRNDINSQPITISIPKLWTIEQFWELHGRGLFEAAEVVAEALSLPYVKPTVTTLPAAKPQLLGSGESKESESQAMSNPGV